MFKFLKERAKRKKIAKDLYETAVLQARLPVFYDEYNVPDSIDGRFEMISLHVGLFIRALNKMNELKQAQALFDVMFVIMDKSIREIGVGDLSVPKHMKRMMKGFKGRSLNYYDALDSDDMKALQEAVKRNIFGTVEKTSPSDIKKIAEYIHKTADVMSNLDYDEIIEFKFPLVEVLKESEQKSA